MEAKMMKVYLLNLDYFYENIEQNEYYTEVYSSLEKAVEDGKYFLNRRYNDKGFRDYEFKVTEIDLEYAEEFSKEKLNIFDREELGKYEPTHIVYYFNLSGKLLYKHFKYKNKQRKYIKGFTMYPEDFTENAGQKFKIGDIVKIKKRNEDEYYSLEYLENWTEDKLYIVRGLPKKAKGQKYFNNIYVLEDDEGQYRFRHYEKDITLYKRRIKMELKNRESFAMLLADKENNISNILTKISLRQHISFNSIKSDDGIEYILYTKPQDKKYVFDVARIKKIKIIWKDQEDFYIIDFKNNPKGDIIFYLSNEDTGKDKIEGDIIIPNLKQQYDNLKKVMLVSSKQLDDKQPYLYNHFCFYYK